MPFMISEGGAASGDFRRTYHGTIATIEPLTERCKAWIDENVAAEVWQWFGRSLAVEPRYVERLVDAMVEDGLVEEDTGG